MRYFIKYIILVFSLSYSIHCEAQYMINASVDKTNAYIGDQIHLKLMAVGPANTNIVLPVIDSIAHFDILSVSKIDSAVTTNNKRLEQEYILVSFDSGYHQIPSYTFLINNKKHFSEEIEIHIQFLQLDVSGDFKDIHDIEAVPAPASKFWWWFSAIIILIAGIVFLLTQRKNKPVVAPKISSNATYEETIKQLQLLRKVHQPTALDYQALINILRGYLENTQEFPATGQTYHHIYRFAQNLKLTLEQINGLKSTLNTANFSVFALMKQSNEQWQADITHVSNVIVQLNANKI